MFATTAPGSSWSAAPTRPACPATPAWGVAEAYNEIVNEWAGRDLGRVRYADAAATVTGPDRTFAERSPAATTRARPRAAADGEVVVRARRIASTSARRR